MNAVNRKFSPRSRIPVAPWIERGFTMVELMVAMTIGLLIVAALLALFVNITRTNDEMAKANSQIENGRFAIQLVENDVVHAGFWGELSPTAAAAAIPDPCAAVAAWDSAYKQNLLAIPVQGFASGATLGTCGVAGVLATSDVLVVSHANTCTWGTVGCDGGADTGPHIQVSECTTKPEASYVIDSTTFPLTQKDCATPAVRRKIVTNIYYLANSPSSSCPPAATCPTLMRANLASGAYVVQPLIEGIEAFHVEYGIDTDGDGSPDGAYVSCAPCTLAQLPNIVAVKVYVLVRNLAATTGYTDAKTYCVGTANADGTCATATLGPFGDGFKRHVFSSTIRLVNPSGRRGA